MLKKLFSKKKKQNKSPLAAGGEKAIGSWDLPLVVLVITLVAFGLVMLFSASYAYAYYRFGDSYRYISNQLFFAVLGIIVMVAASMVDYHIFHRLVPALMALTSRGSHLGVKESYTMQWAFMFRPFSLQ